MPSATDAGGVQPTPSQTTGGQWKWSAVSEGVRTHADTNCCFTGRHPNHCPTPNSTTTTTTTWHRRWWLSHPNHHHYPRHHLTQTLVRLSRPPTTTTTTWHRRWWLSHPNHHHYPRHHLTQTLVDCPHQPPPPHTHTHTPPPPPPDTDAGGVHPDSYCNTVIKGVGWTTTGWDSLFCKIIYTQMSRFDVEN